MPGARYHRQQPGQDGHRSRGICADDMEQSTHHAKFEPKVMNFLAHPLHSMRIARVVDHEMTCAVSPFGRVAAIQTKHRETSGLELAGHHFGN